MLAPKYELYTTIQYWVIALFIWICYVALWTWPMTLESFLVMLLGWSTPVPCLKWIWLTVPELGRPQFSFDRQLKVHQHQRVCCFHCCSMKQFTTRTTNAECCPAQYKLGCYERIWGFSIPRFIIITIIIIIIIIIIISSFIKIGWGVEAVGEEERGVKNRHVPLTWLMAYTTACTTVQARMTLNYTRSSIVYRVSIAELSLRRLKTACEK